jgi:hypothetical protein
LRVALSPSEVRDVAPLASGHHRNLLRHTSSHHPTMAATTTENSASRAPLEVSFPLPKAPHTKIHLQLTNNGPNLLLFLTTATAESASTTPLGSFVYAMPNVSKLSRQFWSLQEYGLMHMRRKPNLSKHSAHLSSPTAGR